MGGFSRSSELLDNLARAIVVCSACDGAGIDSGSVNRIATDLHGVADAAFERAGSLAMSDIEQGGDGLRTAMAELKCNIDELSVLESPLWGTVPAFGNPDDVLSLSIWDDEGASTRLTRCQAEVLVRLGESEEQVELLFAYELRDLFAQARTLRARERTLGSQEVAAWRHGVEAYALFMLVAPLMVPLVPALRASIERSLSQVDDKARARGASVKDDSGQNAPIKLFRILANCEGGFKDTAGCAGRDQSSPAIRAAEYALLGKNPFFLHVEIADDTKGGLSTNERARRNKILREILSERPSQNPTRSKEERQRRAFCANWSAIVDGEWVAIKRERRGVLRLVAGLDDRHAFRYEDPRGERYSFDVDEDGVNAIIRDSLERQRVLREIERDILFDPSLEDREVEAFRATLLDCRDGGETGPLGEGLSLRGLSVWLDGQRTAALLDRCQKYLVERYDRGVVDSLIGDVSEQLARYRDAQSSRMDEDFADAVTALVVAFFWSPKKALDRRVDRITTDASADLVLDAFTPLSSVKPLVLTVPSASESICRPYVVAVEPRDAQRRVAAVRCVLGRSTAEVAIGDAVRMERDGESGAYRMVSTFAEQMRPCLNAVVSEAQAKAAPAKPFGMVGLDDVRNAEQWHESGNGWMLLPGDRGVSGVHVAIVQADGSWWCADAGSHNGTVVVRALRNEGSDMDSCGPLGAPMHVFCLEGRVRDDGTRGGGKFFARVERRLRGAGFALDSARVAAVRLRYGDVILLGDHTEVRVAWL